MVDLWLVAVLMLVAALWFIVPPLFRTADWDRDDSGERDLTAAQLAELDAQHARGELDEAGYWAARRELAQRQPAAGEPARTAGSQRRVDPLALLVAIVLAIAVPVAAAGAYWLSGNPGMPDRPLSERGNPTGPQAVDKQARQDLVVKAGKLKQRVKEQPDNGRLWAQLGKARLSLGQPRRAAVAFEEALSVTDRPPAALHAALGAALVKARRGKVGKRAAQAFRQALARDDANARALYYLGQRALQQDKPERAIERWQTLLATAPADAPWRELVQGRLRALAKSLGRDPAKVLPSGEPSA